MKFEIKNLKFEIINIKNKIRPYTDVLVFMLTLLVANYAWKWTFTGDENGDMVTWFGFDVTAPFEFMACHIARLVYEMVSLFRDTVYMVGDHSVRFESGTGTTIIWGCTGLKQSFIWMCLILTVRALQPELRAKTWLHKLWFIPLGWICCYVFNILRIFLIALFMEFHPEWFHLLHDHIFKYAFYAMLFGMWVIFVEKIRPRA